MNMEKTKKAVLLALFAAAVCISLLTVVDDPDIFWHLATGKWIAEHRELPKEDPFAYTTPLSAHEDNYRAKIILTQYWLANLVQYGMFSLGGYEGIIALRVMIALLTLLLVGVHMRKKGLHYLSIAVLLLPLFGLLYLFGGDRPNQLTFLFLALFMYLADSLKQGEKKGLLLPVIFLLWANMHGGFLMGAVMAVIMLGSELTRKLFLKAYPVKRRFLAVLSLTLAVGFVNPNGYNGILSLLYEMPGSYMAGVTETRSPLSYLRLDHNVSFMLILGITVMVVSAYFISQLLSQAQNRKEKALYLGDELLLAIFLGGMSFTAVRVIPLFALVALPMISPLFIGRFEAVRKKASTYYIPEFMMLALLSGAIYVSYPYTILKRPIVSSFYPEDAVQYIQQKKLQGRFFNFSDWGGYLIWRFYPERFVFIDGRSLILGLYNIQHEILLGDHNKKIMGRPVYMAILDSFSVRHLLLPATDVRGQMIPVLRSLVEAPEWRLIFVGKHSLIFSRDSIEPSYDKKLSYNLVLEEALGGLSRTPENPNLYLTFAKANTLLGRPKETITWFEAALKSRPALRGGPAERALNLLKQGREIPVDMNYK